MVLLIIAVKYLFLLCHQVLDVPTLFDMCTRYAGIFPVAFPEKTESKAGGWKEQTPFLLICHREEHAIYWCPILLGVWDHFTWCLGSQTSLGTGTNFTDFEHHRIWDTLLVKITSGYCGQQWGVVVEMGPDAQSSVVPFVITFCRPTHHLLIQFFFLWSEKVGLGKQRWGVWGVRREFRGKRHLCSFLLAKGMSVSGDADPAPSEWISHQADKFTWAIGWVPACYELNSVPSPQFLGWSLHLQYLTCDLSFGNKVIAGIIG